MKTSQIVLVVLLAIASFGTTLLIGLSVVRQRAGDGDHATQDGLRGGAADLGEDGELPVLVNIPRFTLTDQTGEPLGSDQLDGKVWIVGFVFTRCAGPCPMMTSRMAELHFQLRDAGRFAPEGGNVRLVTITVDPDYDTPAVLAEYARLAHADNDHWKFLTGTRRYIWELIKDGFKLPVGDNPDDKAMPILHSQKFVLVDRLGRIRGYYDGLKDDGRAALMRDVDRLANQ